VANITTTTDRINVLLEDIERGDYPERSDLEETLTTGYAWALQLDAQCVQLERQISVNAAELAQETSEERARELSTLARLLTRKRRERDSLRSLLGVLRSGAQARVA
jgi:hypothetical protein